MRRLVTGHSYREVDEEELLQATIILSTILFNGIIAGDRGNFSAKDTPSSQEINKFGSIGNIPKNGTPNFSAIVCGQLLSLRAIENKGWLN